MGDRTALSKRMPGPHGPGTHRPKLDCSRWGKRNLAPYAGMWAVYGVIVLAMEVVIRWFAV